MAKKSIYESLAQIERRYLYILLIVCVLAPMIKGIGLPVAVTDMTRGYYDVITELDSEDIVFDMMDINFRIYMEEKAGIIVTLRTMIEREAKIIFVFGRAETRSIFLLLFGDPENGITGYFTPLMEQYDYKEGEDYVVLGYKLVNQAAAVSMANDFKGFIENDWKGRPIADTFAGTIEDASDFDLVWWQSGMNIHWPVNFYAMDFGAPTIAFGKGVNIAGWSIYLDTPYLQGLAGSTRGGAELEALSGHPGDGLQAMDSFTLAHYLLIAAIIAGNIGYFGMSKDERARDAESEMN